MTYLNGEDNSSSLRLLSGVMWVLRQVLSKHVKEPQSDGLWGLLRQEQLSDALTLASKGALNRGYSAGKGNLCRPFSGRNLYPRQCSPLRLWMEVHIDVSITLASADLLCRKWNTLLVERYDAR